MKRKNSNCPLYAEYSSNYGKLQFCYGRGKKHLQKPLLKVKKP